MNASELAAWLVEHADDHTAQVYAVDQFGVAICPVVSAQVHPDGSIMLDIEVPEDQ